MNHIARHLVKIACLCLLLAGCATKGDMMTPDQKNALFVDYQNGKAVLDCDMSCSWTWITSRRVLNGLYITQQWDELARRVVEIGYQEDLGYFWLGQAAEATGHPEAAYKYYRITLAMQNISYANAHCSSRSDGCFNIPIFSAAAQRIAAIEAFYNRPSPPASQPPSSSNRSNTRQSTTSRQSGPATTTQAPAPPVRTSSQGTSAQNAPMANLPQDAIEIPPIRR